MTSANQDQLAAWWPAPVSDTDPLSAAPVAALSAALGEQRPVAVAGEALPPLWHWLHFLEWVPQPQLGTDGHPANGYFLPPMPDRRRMVAGGRLEVSAPLVIGEPCDRTRTLAAVTPKRGRSGDLVFVTVRTELSQGGQLCVVEESDIVYRSGDPVRPPAEPRAEPTQPLATIPEATAPEASWHLSVQPDPTLLFRFSALTANAHRIHYDAPYTTQYEGYPGLVVHGPLLVILMLELARRHAPERQLAAMSYRLHHPIFVGQPVHALAEPPDDDGLVQARVATNSEPSCATAELRFS